MLKQVFRAPPAPHTESFRPQVSLGFVQLEKRRKEFLVVDDWGNLHFPNCIIADSRAVGLNPSQEDGEHDEHRGVQGEHAADEAALSGGLPVVAEHGNHEERDVNGHKNGKRAPPRINPYEAGRFRQEDFEHGEKGRVEDGEEQPVVDAEDFCFGVCGEQFRQGKSGDGEHEAKFDADAD